MKRRWTQLFACSLVTLIGMSWLASSFGISVTELLSIGLVGMMAGTAIGFAAMVKGIRAKWPAAVVLICAGPMAIEILRTLPDAFMIARFLGAPYIVIVGGTIATLSFAISILARSLAEPPPPPPVAPARVV